MSKTAIVFAPHQDDETLGCGGTIIRKKETGADIKIVFMTDGSQSNDVIPKNELKDIRVQEAFAACQQLGVAEQDVLFLGFEDGSLSQSLNPAIDKVTNILLDVLPQEVFIPYYKDPHDDHLATNKIIVSALQRYGRETIVYEYPVWLWQRWPWTGKSIAHKPLKERIISTLHILKDFRYAVYIGDLLDLKRAALAEHKSQVNPNPRWGVLGDISNGEFLDCFFQEYEFFCRQM